MAKDIEITATDDDGTVLGSTTLRLDSDAFQSIRADRPGSETDATAGRRGFLGGLFAGGIGGMAVSVATTAGDGPVPGGRDDLRSAAAQPERVARLTSGDDLGRRVRDAIDAGRPSIRIHPHEDGTGWSWDTDVVHDTATEGALELVVHDTVIIDYTGDGRPLTVVSDGEGETAGDNAFRLAGGRWTASGDPSAWLRLDDQIGYHVAPRVVDWPAEEQATALEVRNVDAYSELGIIEGTYKCGNGIDFVPASETGGDGTDSFQGTTIQNVRINVHADGGFGIRPTGHFTYCLVSRPNVFATVAADVDAIRWATSSTAPAALGTTVVSLQAEAVGDSPDMTALASADSYNSYYGPLHVNPKAGGGADETDDDRYAVVMSEANTVRMGDWGETELVYDFVSGTLLLGEAGLRTTADGELVAVDGDGSETTLT